MVQSMTSLGKCSANKAVYSKELHKPGESKAASAECSACRTTSVSTSVIHSLSTQTKVSMKAKNRSTLLDQELCFELGISDQRVKLREVEAATHGHRPVGLSDVPRG